MDTEQKSIAAVGQWSRFGMFTVLLCIGLGGPVRLQAAADAEMKSDAARQAESSARFAIFPSQETLPKTLANQQADAATPSLDAYQWLDETAQRGLLVHRQAHGQQARGTILLLSAEYGTHSNRTFVGRLRQQLPAADWHTYLLSLPLVPTAAGTAELAQWSNEVARRVREAVAVVGKAHADLPLVALAEGLVCAELARLANGTQGFNVDSLVLLNQPLPKGIQPLAELSLPTLLLQVLPFRMPKGYPLAASIQTLELPRVSPRQPRSLVQRKLTGWLRGFEKPNANVAPPVVDLDASVGVAGQ